MNVADLSVKLGFHADARPLEHVEHQLEKVKERLEFLGAVEVVKGLYELAERFSGMGVQLETASASAGLTTDAFQKLSYAAAQSAVSQDQLTTGLAHLSRTLQEAKDGSQTAIDAFAKAHITPAQIAGFRTSSDALHALSNSFQATSDPIQKQALAMQLLGRGSVNMVNLLNKGGAAIDSIGQKAESAGAILGEDDIEALAKFEETMVSAGQTIKVAFAKVAAVVGPVIGEVVKHLQALYAANRSVFNVNLREWGGDFASVLGFITGGIELVVGWMLRWADAHPLLLKRIASVVVAGMGLSLISGAVLKVFGAVKTLISAAGTAKDVFAAIKPVAELAFQPFLAIAGLARSGLAKIVLLVARLVAFAFPALGAAIESFAATLLATPIAPFLAGLAAVVVIGKTIWDLLHGNSFRDTWLGEMVAQVLDLPNKLKGVWHFLKDGTYDAPALPEHAFPSYGQAAAEATSSAGAGAADTSGFFGNVFKKLGITHAAAEQVSAGAANGTLLGAVPPAALAMDFGGMPAAPSQNITTHVDAPVTITVPPGMAPEKAAAAVTEGVQKHLDRVNREAMRSVMTAGVY